MKRYFLILGCLAMLSVNVSAKLWRVNNNAGVSRDYGDLTQTVIDQASDGDTIFIEGSVTPYTNSIEVDKKLCIIGPGYYLVENQETQHLKQSAKVNRITFVVGSSGSVLAGIEQIRPETNAVNAGGTALTVAPASWPAAAASVIINEDNISIVNCRLYMVEIKNDKTLTDISVKKCWFGPGVIRTSGTEQVLNLTIGNNFFRNEIAATNATAGSIILSNNTKANINNNTFYLGFKIETFNSIINNNAFFFPTAANGSLTADATNTYQYNIFRNALGGMTHQQNGNVLNSGAVLDWFSGSGGNDLYDGYFTAKSGTPSPLKDNAAAGNNEMGMYGGLSPYQLSGLTNIPAVYEIVMPTEVSSETFNVTVKVKAH